MRTIDRTSTNTTLYHHFRCIKSLTVLMPMYFVRTMSGEYDCIGSENVSTTPASSYRDEVKVSIKSRSGNSHLLGEQR